MTVSEPTVYIDFLCPWAYRGAMWLALVEKAGRIQPTFRFFSLSQNHQARDGAPAPPIWERDLKAKGLPAFLAATAARSQDGAAADRFRLALQRARHEDQLPVDEATTHRLAAELVAGNDEDLALSAHASALGGGRLVVRRELRAFAEEELLGLIEEHLVRLL